MRLRRGVGAALLLVFAADAAKRYDWRNLPRFVRETIRRGSASSDTARLAGTGFWFDRDYAAFLDAVRRATPSDATVAVAVPPRPPVYLYQAVFTLAPRHVVALEDASSGSYVAYYRDESALSLPRSRRIPGGVLVLVRR
jgi:hypothetical protein